jgi:hypothetical protein
LAGNGTASSREGEGPPRSTAQIVRLQEISCRRYVVARDL